MQVNTLNFENLNQVFHSSGNTKETITGNVTGFFGVAMEKSGLNMTVANSYPSYDKNGSDDEEKASAEQTVSGQAMLDYINQNIDKLKDLVTDEDYSAMSELGLAPDKENPDTLVTVYERIQIELAAYCDDYEAAGSISSDKMETVLGSKAMANAVKMAEEAGTLTDESKAYLLKNDMEPTIENVYKAVHSTQQGTDTGISPLTDSEWDDLQSQITNLLNQSGLESTQENLTGARWLMDKQIPVTVDNLVKLNELNHADMKHQDVLQSNIAMALMFGMDGTKAYVTEGWIDRSEIKETKALIENVSDEVIYDIAEDDAVLNVANIKKYQERENQADAENGEKKERDYENAAYVKAKTVIVEARLVMTSGSLLNMQKLGINITYTEISVMVSETKSENQDYYASFFSENEEIGEQTDSVASLMEIMQSMSQIPSAVMGGVYNENVEFTISALYNESSSVSAKFSQAELTYEAVGTQVRGDLGDSIEKAFDSIDDILKNIGEDVNESSRRAARILGYNQLEINHESIQKMESLMSELDYVRDNLTPKTAALLVENQVNILNTDIRELNKNLIELNQMIGADESEEFAKYLWKLEKSGKISKEDRDQYVDMYRTLNMVEKSDSSAIGAVAAMGVEFTLGNLLSAVKSRSKTDMDVSVDDTFGLLDSDSSGEEGNYEDIAEFVKKMAAKIKSGLNAENVEKVYKNGNYTEINLGNLVDVVSDNESLRNNGRLSAEYVKQVMDTYFEEASADGITEDTVLTLLESGQSATVENIISAIELSTPGSDFRKYLLDKDRQKEIADAAENILENFDGESEAQESVTALKNLSLLQNGASANIEKSYEEIKKLSDINRNMRFMARSAQNESYQIPVDIGGESVSIRVTLVHGEEQGTASISMNTAQFGRIDCTIRSVSMTSGIRSEAVVYCETSEMENKLAANKELFLQNVGKLGLESTFSMEIVKGSTGFDRNNKKSVWNGTTEETEETKVDSSYLYKLSKSFIKSVKECLENNR